MLLLLRDELFRPSKDAEACGGQGALVSVSEAFVLSAGVSAEMLKQVADRKLLVSVSMAAVLSAGVSAGSA